ncbi:AtpZ/AtpI family protein [Erythrobacter sp. WG]|uniref:AtpZ/AtpI family protein n=1 Tax=Erythrobacter sp. WG TaxID=2985510 RepID=UPI0022704E19|nr:AtpZ/AtpI family protein [Erythrobacter sp. WG]MCX9146768.1 AtpZ/AtpI family protein [Erythrobacter sp. WG]
MSDEKPAREPIQEDARIDALEARLRAAREREEERNRRLVKGVDANYRSGDRVLANLLGGIVGGLVIGFAIDALLGIAPWGLLAGLFLGTGSAFRSIILSAKARPAEPDQGPDSDV